MLLTLLAVATTIAAPVDYRDASNWLCRPGRSDACTPDAHRAVIGANGTVHREAVIAAAAPQADCFYVYPTASNDPGANSGMVPGIEEAGQAASQVAALAPVCRIFAPVYRQVTLTALHAGRMATADWEMAYGDVRAAFDDYLARDSGGRPFVLIGHSQGSAMLKRLVADEIDGKPLARRLLSAILPGTTVLVPAGKDVGGDFKALPLCRSDRQTGCIVTWSSYRDTAALPKNALFGKSSKPAMTAGCTNPAALRGGVAPLDSIIGFPWWDHGFVRYHAPAWWPLPERFARVPAALTGVCTANGGFSFLAVHVAPAGSPVDAAMDPVAVGDAAYPEWGLHVMDIHLVAGDLVRLVAAQTAAWAATAR